MNLREKQTLKCSRNMFKLYIIHTSSNHQRNHTEFTKLKMTIYCLIRSILRFTCLSLCGIRDSTTYKYPSLENFHHNPHPVSPYDPAKLVLQYNVNCCKIFPCIIVPSNHGLRLDLPPLPHHHHHLCCWNYSNEHCTILKLNKKQ